jgi:hypothetical protein
MFKVFDGVVTAVCYRFPMKDFSKRPVLSYVVRLWAEFNGTSWVWRVSLRVVDQLMSSIQGFSSLPTAVDYLMFQMEKAIAEEVDE